MSTLGRESQLAQRIVRMCNAEAKQVHFNYTGGLIINDTKVGFFKIISLDYHRDFVGNFSDILTVEVMMDTTKYYSDVLDNLENLEGWITKKQMAENSILYINGGKVKTKKYKVFAINPPTKGLGNMGNINKISDAEQTITKASFQFIDKEAFDLRMTTFSGLMESTTPAEALRMVLSSTGEKAGIKGIQSTEWDIIKPMTVIIPRGITVKDLPHYIQNEYGIYNHGIGCYIFDQDNNEELYWFIYPLFNNTRYTKEYFKLNIFVVPQSLDDKGVPRTYYVDDGVVNLYTTSESSMVQNKPADQINEGTGISVINPAENEALSTKPAGNNKYLIDGKDSMSTYNIVDRADKVQNIIPVYGDVTNHAKLVSSMAGMNGTYLTITWTAANPELLHPGIPVKIQYLDGVVKTLYGTLHEYHAILVKSGKTAGETPFICTVQMKIYVTEDPGVSV